jgi:hypothetical protein
MKRILFSVTIMLTIGLTAVFASSDNPVNQRVAASFKKEFPGVEKVCWRDIDDYKVAVFAYGGYLVNAYFNEEGELSGCARNILSAQLPLQVARSIDKFLPGGDIMEVTEIINQEGTSYVLIVETGSKQYKVILDTNGIMLKLFKTKK